MHISLIEVYKLNLLIAAIITQVWHFVAKSISIRVITIVWLSKYLIIIDFATHIIWKDHRVCNIQLLIQKWLHANIDLALLLSLYLDTFLESSRHARLLDHDYIWILSDWFTNGLWVCSLVELRLVLLILNACIVWYATLIHIEVGTTNTLILGSNDWGADSHNGIAMLLR